MRGDRVPCSDDSGGFQMTDDENDDMTVLPIPSSETEAEHRRIRASNDRDPKAEREGRKNRHNAGYDEAADGKIPEPQIDRVVDE
jgi:hypothetical protein